MKIYYSCGKRGVLLRISTPRKVFRGRAIVTNAVAPNHLAIFSMVEKVLPAKTARWQGAAQAGGTRLSSLQYLALSRLASQSGWCDTLDIGTSHTVIGRLLANGLVERLPADRLHPPRYRINAAGTALLNGSTPLQRDPVDSA